MSGSVVKQVQIYTYLQNFLIKVPPQNDEYLAYQTLPKYLHCTAEIVCVDVKSPIIVQFLPDIP